MMPEQVIDAAEPAAWLRAGDETALASPIDVYGPAVRKLARCHVPNEAVVDEVVQETWLAVIEDIERFEGRSSVKTRVIRNLRNIARRHGGREDSSVAYGSATGPWDDGDNPFDPDCFLPFEHPHSLTGTPPEVAARSKQDVLLATKLHVPSAQSDIVSRPRLANRLDEGLARGVILVSAPAGFGKTSLLAEWTRQSPRSIAWLSLDAGDNDPARFWRHAVAAVDGVHPGIAERLAPLLGVPAPPSFEGLVTTLINELASRPGEDEVVLVLDDYHLIDVQPVHASLTYLLEHLPPGLHLVLACRADPPLALARLRASRQLAELRSDELRFTAREAAALLRPAVGPDLPDAAAAELASRTEGWVAGLQLAALSLRGRSDVAGLMAAFSGRYRYVLDYFTEEVLERQSPQVQEFLLEVSVLERLSGELCDAVTGRTGSQAMLEAIERANLFLVPLDEVRGWWRFHQLFGELLRARVEQERAEREGRGVAAPWGRRSSSRREAQASSASRSGHG